jgi:hypothetical protein
MMTGVCAVAILLGCFAFAALLLGGVLAGPYLGRRP